MLDHYKKSSWQPDAIDFGSGCQIKDLVVVRDKFIDTVEADCKLYQAIFKQVEADTTIAYDSLDRDQYDYHDDYCQALTSKRFTAAKDGVVEYNNITKKKKKHYKF